MMEEQVNQYKTVDQIGRPTHTSESDDYIRDRHIHNIDQLRNADGQLADIIRMGDEAVKNSRQAGHDINNQSHIIHQFYFYDQQVNAWMDKATGKVAALERGTYAKKVIMCLMVFVLGILFLVSLGMKITS